MALTDEITQDAIGATVTGKPVYARITRIFRLTGELTPVEAVQQIIE